jgi:hypothetical protein
MLMVEFISSARSSARTFYRRNAMKYHDNAWAVTRCDAHRMWLGLRGTSSSMLVNGREESIHEQERPVGRQQRGMVLLATQKHCSDSLQQTQDLHNISQKP